ncbi:extracellular solute-binding protein [Ferrovibrio terrae]|uniref:extracellular solute-binding protein n=1 Tax=Ferrovibrio terrae TaxID=2594003 RepID=UPI003137847F
MKLAALLTATLLLAGSAIPVDARAQPRHGLSAFGDLKHPPGFSHFDYVNPNAPKGGELRSWQLETFDNLNPLILKGVSAQNLSLTFQSLMARGKGEPDAVYADLAESAELAPDRSWAAFTINPKARFSDGSPVTAEDVVFTIEATQKDGHPLYQLILRDVESVTAESRLRVVFRFADTESRRDMPLTVAQLPILSKAWFRNRDFTTPTMEPVLGSGPYRISRIDAGRSLVFERVKDWWARDLPVNKGRYNFDWYRDDYYRDREIAFEAFFAGEYDFREEVTARHWAASYTNKPAFNDGRVKREVLKDETPSGVQAWFLNSRKPHLNDARVRQAINLAYDYEWANKTLFYGLYKRTRSMFENSDLAATGLPSAAERDLLEPFRDRVPPEVFTTEFQPPRTDGSGNNRANLKQAQQLLLAAGWVIRDGKLVDAKGKPFELEFMLYEPSFQRIINPFARNLERIGITISIRVVDLASFENRMRNFDYDVMSRRFVQPLTPGIEQRNYWASRSAATVGSFNFSGVNDPVVDDLIEHIVKARNRDELRAATRALDRVLMWGWYVVPHWYSGTVKLGYWDRFGRPAQKPAYDVGLTDTWWVDPTKDKALNLQRQR